MVRMTVGGHGYKTTFLSNIVGYFLKQDKNKLKYSLLYLIACLPEAKKKTSLSSHFIT